MIPCTTADRGHGPAPDPIEVGAGAGDRTMLARTAALLEAFTESRQLLSLDELTARCGLPRSTTHRLAARLVEVGWLEHEPSGYRIGVGMFRTGRRASRRVRLRAVALPHLERLRGSTGLPVTLAVRAQDRMVCLEHRPGAALALPLHDGATLQMDSALGAALLAARTASVATAAARVVEVSDLVYHGVVCAAVGVGSGPHLLGALAISTTMDTPIPPVAVDALGATAYALAAEYRATTCSRTLEERR